MSLLGSALKTAAVGAALGAAGNLLSQVRSMNIPKGAESFNKSKPTSAVSGSNDTSGDWRVRLSIPPTEFFKDAQLIKPLIDAGGLVFPYTPTITINHSASYSDTTVTHQNYQFITYQYSKVSDITVVGDFAVEDALQAQYWLSAVHFLRTVTKMFVGDDKEAGNPPPILKLNAYGDFVFKNVPVVVKSFNVTMPKDVDYIKTNLRYLPNPDPTNSQNPNNPTGKLNIGSMMKAGVINAFQNTAAGKIGAGLLGAANSFQNGATTPYKSPKTGSKSLEGDSHVPTQSSMSLVLMPVYSRTQVREFNLKDFLDGKFVKDGYV